MSHRSRPVNQPLSFHRQLLQQVGLVLVIAGLVSVMQARKEEPKTQMTADEFAATLVPAREKAILAQSEMESDWSMVMREGGLKSPNGQVDINDFMGSRPEVSNGQRLYTIEVSQ